MNKRYLIRDSLPWWFQNLMESDSQSVFFISRVLREILKLYLHLSTQPWRRYIGYEDKARSAIHVGPGNKWLWVVGFMVLPLYPSGSSPPHGMRWLLSSWGSLDMKSRGKSFLLPGCQDWNPNHSIHSHLFHCINPILQLMHTETIFWHRKYIDLYKPDLYTAYLEMYLTFHFENYFEIPFHKI